MRSVPPVGALSTVPRRSRPAWMESGLSAEIAAPPISVQPNPTVKEVMQPPVVTRTAPLDRAVSSSSELCRVPMVNDIESHLVAVYVLSHLVRRPQLDAQQFLLDTLCGMVCLKFLLVGAHAAGTSSRQNSSSFLTFVAPSGAKKSALIESLRVSGAPRGWKVAASSNRTQHALLVTVPSTPNITLRVVLDTLIGGHLVRRTTMQKCYTQVVEPKIAIAMCLIREILHQKLPTNPFLPYMDDIIFQILITALIEKRVIPSIMPLPANADASLSRDNKIWSRNDIISVDELRKSWHATGYNVAGSCTVSGMIRMFWNKCLESEDLAWANVCLLTNELILDEGSSVPFGAVIFLRQLHAAVCSSSDTLELLDK